MQLTGKCLAVKYAPTEDLNAAQTASDGMPTPPCFCRTTVCNVHQLGGGFHTFRREIH